ncbi:hypothetical protein MSC49_02070 [Methylosinus sp. C49]|uniref:hypothetical protein n=1 Tax=Methylosinus sp. C49 TaxID=2699395 RepID=UPI0013668E36|nr:hypothetical protein [Methylosinus sp. C49]BBU60272.1 hypothetical protein MSC49_02070 [Methylosinus sp. C49]
MKRIFTTIAIFGCCAQMAHAESAAVGAQPNQRRGVCAVGEARLTNVKGGVLLSRGGSFTELRDAASLSPGDRVLVREGSASITLGDKTAVRADAGAMVTIAENDGAICAKRVSSNPATVAQESSFDPGPYVAGGFAAIIVGVGVGVGVSNTGNNNDDQQRNAALLLLQSLSN